MPFTETPIAGVKIFEPRIFEDERGYFFEAFNYQSIFAEDINPLFVQDNQAKSSYGVLRGLHYQVPPFAQAKLVRVLQGKVLDVVVDLRAGSATYGQHYSVILSDENQKQLYVPRGFAHGYLVLSPTAIFFYKVDNYYSKAHEGGLRYNDPQLSIDWGIPDPDIIIAERDKTFPEIGQHRQPV